MLVELKYELTERIVLENNSASINIINQWKMLKLLINRSPRFEARPKRGPQSEITDHVFK
jgi:hypothetical protein